VSAGDAARTELLAALGAELQRPAPAAVSEMARQLAAHGGAGVAAVLFYGSALRDDSLDGVLDFYVLTDRAGDWPASHLVALAGRVLPPNVGYLGAPAGQPGLRAKYAVMTLAQFSQAMSTRRLDTTLWARFSQPCLCVHARSAADAAVVQQAIGQAVATAAWWAAALGPAGGEAADYWRALYQHTYRAEIRVERHSRGADLVSRDVQRYERLLPLAWQVAGLPFKPLPPSDVGAAVAGWTPGLSPAARAGALRRWRLRQRLGRPLNLLRLLKAALTFDNAIDYVAWKVERHSGYRIEPSEFQRRHPLLAAPGLYWRLRSHKVLR